jgi:glycosyltransferase involved in cell wall biosynthesis
MLTSVCLSTRNKAPTLDQVLASIRVQVVPFDYEIVVADDGSTDNTKAVCQKYGAVYLHLVNPRYRNPAIARNASYRAAKGDIVIAQSDDVVHKTDCVRWLTENLQANEILFAHVYNVEADGTPCSAWPVYCGVESQRPFFFLGSLWRKDIYAIGGNDENFIEPCWDDLWFGECLINGLGRVPRYATEAVGWHMNHGHAGTDFSKIELSHQLYLKNAARGDWTNKPWEFK